MKKDCFNSIDELPIWNFWKISETGNLIYLRKNADYSKKDYSLYDLWESLNDEYFNDYGINERLIQLMKLKKDWVLKKAEYFLDGNRFALNEIDMIESDIWDLENSATPKLKNTDTLIFLEEKLGREIDSKATSVRKFYDYINYYSKK